MAIKNLQTPEMLLISGTWLAQGSDVNAALLSVTELAGSAPRLETVHTALLKAGQPVANKALAEIIDEEGRLDVRHDAIIRGAFGTLTALAELLGGSEGAAQIALRDFLLPEGLQSQLKSYAAEAGQAAALADRMTPEVRTKTDAVPIGSGPNAKPLTVYLDELIGLGGKLGELEAKRATIENAATQAGALSKARLAWVRVVNALVANAELAELPADKDALLFDLLRSTEKKADERARESLAAARAKEAAEKPADPPAPGK
ncbi:hypothetical protein A7982_12357 [Minicystis rosea]|nr:hypothetical protein A7982_12357 [Minicystis rosea]